MQGDKDQQVKQLKELSTRYEWQDKRFEGMPGDNTEGAKFLSNKTHYSPVDRMQE